jgi:hypothetical protein
MRLATALPFLVMAVIGFGLSLENANAELIPNNAFVMEGSGFAVTDEFIQNSQIDILFTTGDQVGSSIREKDVLLDYLVILKVLLEMKHLFQFLGN